MTAAWIWRSLFGTYPEQRSSPVLRAPNKVPAVDTGEHVGRVADPAGDSLLYPLYSATPPYVSVGPTNLSDHSKLPSASCTPNVLSH